MRKKYLSALLFGALLVTSAGTFTSCKDYDDDIKNLQEQIDVIKTDLASLTETVNNLDGVKDMSFTDGKLVIETGKGKKVEVDIPTADGVAKIELKDNVLYVNDEPKGEVVIPEDKDVVVEVREDGKLYIDDKVQDLEIGSKVVMVDNGDYYTMTIDGKESYNLPKYNAVSSISKLTLLKEKLTFGSKNGSDGAAATDFYWGYKASATNDMKTWKGPKGPVANNQLMVGQIQVEADAIEVLPTSFDLSAQKLELVDSKGNVAPVNVKAIAKSGLIVDNGSRAGSADGKWALAVEQNEKLTKDNVISSFYNSNPAGHILYALKVNGVVMTGYDIALKVYKTDVDGNGIDPISGVNTVDGLLSANNDAMFKNESNGKFELDSKNLGNTTEALLGTILVPAGKTTTFTYQDDVCYDSYIAFEGTYADKAKALGIEANGMNISVPATATAVTGLQATVYVMNVDGTVKNNKLYINTTGIGTENTVELEATPVKVMPNLAEIKIDLSKAFEGMTPAEIESVAEYSYITFTEPQGQNNFLLAGTVLGTNVKLYDANGDEVTGTQFSSTAGSLSIVKSAKLFTTSNVATDAQPGDYKIIMTLYNGNPALATTSEVRNIIIPVTVSLPEFTDIFDKSDNWNSDEFKASLYLTDEAIDGESGKSYPGFNLSSVYVPKGGAAIDGNLSVSIPKVGNTTVYKSTTTEGEVLLQKAIVKDGALITESLSMTPSYKIFGQEGLKVTGTQATAKLQSFFAEPKLVYYVDGEAKDKAVVTNGVIAPLTGDGTATSPKQGLALQIGTYEVAVQLNGNGFLMDKEDFKLKDTYSFSGTYVTNQFMTEYAKLVEFEESVPGLQSITPIIGTDGVTLQGIKQNDSSTLVITFTDVMGVQTKAEIKF